MKQNDKQEQQNEYNEEGVSIYTLWSKVYAHYKYLKTKWIAISIFVLLGIIAGVMFSITRKPKYTAQMSFTIEQSSAQSGIAGLASQLGVSLGGSKESIFEGYNIIAFFQSRLMVQKTLLSEDTFENGKKELLANRYVEFNHFRDSWKKNPKLRNVTFSANEAPDRVRDSLLGQFVQQIIYGQLDVDKADKRLTILTLTYSCTDELFSKAFAETLCKNVIQFYTNTLIEKTVHNIDVLQRQTDSVRARLSHSLINVAASADAVPNANPYKKILVVSQQNKTVDAEIDRSALLTLASNLQAAKISLNQETPLIDFIDTPILPLDVIKIGKIKAGFVGGFIGMIVSIFIFTFRRKNY